MKKKSLPTQTKPAPVSRITLCLQEKTLILLMIFSLSLIAWGGGGMYVWAQTMGGVSACIALFLAISPRARQGADAHRRIMKISLLPKLWRFPFFWLGLLYFAFVVVQIFNPAWRYVSSQQGWWLEPINYITWLPHGVTGTTFDPMNAWRTLLIEGSAWLLACAVWTGFTQRRSYRLLLTGLAINGALLALVILIQRMTAAKKMLWLWEVPGNYFTGPFIYKNHGGAYLVLMLALCLGLAWWHDREAHRNFKKSNPGIVFIFFALFTWVALIFTYARAATVLGTVLIVLTLIAYLLRLFWRKNRRSPLAVGVIGIVSVSFLVVCLYSLNTSSVWNRFQRLFKEDQSASITARQLTAQATVEMAKPNLVVGHGMGSFRYVFPIYQSRYPEIFEFKYKAGKKTVTKRYYWEHAHNDYAELLAEGGLVAVGLLVMAGGALIVLLVKRRVWGQPPLVIFLAGAGAVIVNASFEFPFHNPAVLCTTAVMLSATLSWSQMEFRRRAR